MNITSENVQKRNYLQQNNIKQVSLTYLHIYLKDDLDYFDKLSGL